LIYFLIGELIERGVGEGEEGEVEREEMRQRECNRSCRFEYIKIITQDTKAKHTNISTID
jgi:hypothetical protein